MVSQAVAGAMVDTVAGDVFALFPVGVRRRAVHARLSVLLWKPLALHVSLDPEVGEEHEEEGSIHPDEVDDHGELVIAGVHEVILGSVKRHQDKLDLVGQKSITNIISITNWPST